MVDFILGLPVWAGAVLVLGFWVVLLLALTEMSHRLHPTWLKAGYSAMAPTLGSPLFSAFLLLAAFLTATLTRDFDRGREAVQGEVAALQQVATIIGTADATQDILRELRSYTKLVIEEEWPMMQRGGAGVGAADRLQALSTRVLKTTALDPDLRKALRDAVVRIQDCRTRRVLVAEDKLPGVVWFALVLCALISAFFIQCVHLTNIGAARTLSILYGLVIGVLLLVLTLLDNPYAGTVSVNPEPIQRFLATIGG